MAFRDSLVVAIVGDGGFQMTNQELSTALQYDLPVKVLIMNNGYLGMVRQWQEMFYDRAYSEVDISVAPDFVRLPKHTAWVVFAPGTRTNCTMCSPPGWPTTDPPSLTWSSRKRRTFFPIVPAGGNSRDMIVHSEGV